MKTGDIRKKGDQRRINKEREKIQSRKQTADIRQEKGSNERSRDIIKMAKKDKSS